MFNPNMANLSVTQVPCSRRLNSTVLQQRGLTLIELMVGITIGLLVVLAAVGSLAFTQITSTVVSDSSRLQQKADNIFRNIGFHLVQAGAIELSPSAADAAVVTFSSAYPGFKNTVTGATVDASVKQIYSIHGVNGDGSANSTAPDILRVSYQDTGTSRDCLGNRPTVTGVNVDSQFSVTGTDLMCLGATNASAQSIADGVEDFQVTYGIQTGDIGNWQYRFYRADEMLGAGFTPNWANIQAVEICIQITGDNQGNPQPGLVTTGCRGQTVTNDGKLRRVFRRTFALRNALL